MMTNLFSIFDPSTYYMNLSWLSCFIPLLIYNNSKFFMNSKPSLIMKSIKYSVLMEMKNLMKSNEKKGIMNLFMSIFMLLLLSNFLAMFPFVFTHTAHMSITFSLAFIMWLSIMLFGWLNNFKSMMIHLVPMGTPPALMNFMVIIEMTSNIIRPITLAVRLTANMVAGHLLMSLLANFILMSKMNFLLSIPPMLILSFLECAVAFIQAYVFITLLTLYFNEIF